jgi:hypothetical protein
MRHEKENPAGQSGAQVEVEVNHTAANKASSDRTQAPKSRGGRKSRDKGNRAERAIVRYLRSCGLESERVPLSGAAGGSYQGDIVISAWGADLCVEVKCRADGFRQLYAWLEARDMLILKADRRAPLLVMSLERVADLLAELGVLR